MRPPAPLILLLLAGCATVGPDYRDVPVAVPEKYAEATLENRSAEDAELADWWTRFADRQLDSLVGRALALNLDVQMAAARVREARAREVIAGGKWRPQLAAEASMARTRISENALSIPGPPIDGGSEPGLSGAEFNIFRVGFDASWEIDLFGGGRRAVEAARARTAAASWSRRDLQATVAAEVASAYFDLRTLQQQIDIAKAELARQKREEVLIDARARAGLVSGLDSYQQQSQRAAAAARIPALEAQARAQIHRLGVLTGATPDALIDDLEPPRPLPAVLPDVPAGLPSELLRRRPDIRAAERELAAATADIGVAVADLYPRFSLTAAPALVSTALASLLEWASRSFTVGAGAFWPLFDGGASRGKIEVANARQEQALIAYRATILDALQDVEDSLSRYDSNRHRLEQLKQSLKAAAVAEELARTRYRGGLVSYSDVLTNQARRLSMEEQVIETNGALSRDIVALYKALGGGWPQLETLS